MTRTRPRSRRKNPAGTAEQILDREVKQRFSKQKLAWSHLGETDEERLANLQASVRAEVFSEGIPLHPIPAQIREGVLRTMNDLLREKKAEKAGKPEKEKLTWEEYNARRQRESLIWTAKAEIDAFFKPKIRGYGAAKKGWDPAAEALSRWVAVAESVGWGFDDDSLKRSALLAAAEVDREIGRRRDEAQAKRGEEKGRALQAEGTGDYVEQVAGDAREIDEAQEKAIEDEIQERIPKPIWAIWQMQQGNLWIPGRFPKNGAHYTMKEISKITAIPVAQVSDYIEQVKAIMQEIKDRFLQS